MAFFVLLAALNVLMFVGVAAYEVMLDQNTHEAKVSMLCAMMVLLLADRIHREGW